MIRLLLPSLLLLAAVLEIRADDTTLESTIEARKAEFRKSASSEKIAAYADGIEAVIKAGIVETAKKRGDKAPDFSLTNAKGQTVTLSEELEKGPVVLTWYRGGWCPYCNIQLAAYQKFLSQFEELGAQLIAISPELPDKSLTTAEKSSLRFEVLSDKNLEVADQYGLVFQLTPEVEKLYGEFFDITEYNGEEAATNELPLAATYVIDETGVIQWAFLEADYTKRAEPRDIVNALDGLE